MNSLTLIPASERVRAEIRNYTKEKVKEREEDALLPVLPKLNSVTFVGGGFRTVSYYGFIEAFCLTKTIDDQTRFYGASLGALWCVLAVLRTAPGLHGQTAEDIMNPMFSYIAQTHYNWMSTWGSLHEVVRDAAHGEARQGAYAPRFRCRCSS